jgi:hypothetical protein
MARGQLFLELFDRSSLEVGLVPPGNHEPERPIHRWQVLTSDPASLPFPKPKPNHRRTPVYQVLQRHRIT